MSEREVTGNSAGPWAVMIVEDEAFIALDLARQLDKAGYGVVGPFPSVQRALEALEDGRPDAAILDFTLSEHETSEPIAARLAELGIPFVFMTGYSATGRIEATDFADRPRLGKPCRPNDVLDAVSRLAT